MTVSVPYVAFLRGINVGGNTMIKMEELKRTFEALGCKDSKTVLASGNVIFTTSQIDAVVLTKKIEESLKKTFGFVITVILRTGAEMQTLIAANPFKNSTITPLTRLYVTFLSESHKSTIKTPYASPQKYFTILRITNTDVCSVVTLMPQLGTTDIMKTLEKEFGKRITTRSWNTILKIGKVLEK